MSSEILKHLHLHGVDFSVPQSDIEELLAQPDFTSYSAISEALLKLLEGKRLLQTVFLEIIVFNYEIVPEIKSPRKSSDVNISLLKAAVLNGYRERYGSNISDFDKITLDLWRCHSNQFRELRPEVIDEGRLMEVVAKSCYSKGKALWDPKQAMLTILTAAQNGSPLGVSEDDLRARFAVIITNVREKRGWSADQRDEARLIAWALEMIAERALDRGR